MGSSQDNLRDFPLEARKAAGFELWQTQLGLEPTDWKPLSSIAPGVKEIRIHVLGEWRGVCGQIRGRDLCAALLSEENPEDPPRRY